MGSGITPRKRLGQHFLKSGELAARIAGALAIEDGDVVLEIGPGTGILTEALLESRASSIIAVEIDEGCCEVLENRFGHDDRLRIVQQDILDIDPCDIASDREKLRVAGNLPYYITSPILFRLLDSRSCVRDAVVTVQKEVGDRLVSPPGTRVYGIPSVLFQAFGRVERLFDIDRKAFHPVPAVDSAVIRVTFFEESPYGIEDTAFFQRMVRTVFGQRRKMLRNTLKAVVRDEERLKTLPVDLSRRPEALSVAGFVQLSNALSKKQDGS